MTAKPALECRLHADGAVAVHPLDDGLRRVLGRAEAGGELVGTRLIEQEVRRDPIAKGLRDEVHRIAVEHGRRPAEVGMGTNVQVVPPGNRVGLPRHHVDYRSKAVVEVAARDLSAGLACNVRVREFMLEGHPRDVPQMGVRVDQPGHEVASRAVDHTVGTVGVLGKPAPDGDDPSVAHKHVRRRGWRLSLRRDDRDILDQKVVGQSSAIAGEASKAGDDESDRDGMDSHWMVLL